ncbi:PHP domain-containing protein [Actinopolymorpha alba]|uniref:PHP domain-containing protein n=1 Tax=Actinopolymorpha alba TaxID=533267 RepID=UPI000360D0D0|nr:PHP domain-containing protein [Actinopolymorpha alba]
MQLTGDGHVHSEWSFDTGGPKSASAGLMDAICVRAVQLGLPALAFTEHLDVVGWLMEEEDLLAEVEIGEQLRSYTDSQGVLLPEPFDEAGYLECVERCRLKFPDLRILSGVEFGQPHLNETRARQIVDLDSLDRVNGSLHTIPVSDEPGAVRAEPGTLYRKWPAAQVVRGYLAEVPRMVEGSAVFEVFCHIDYWVRSWPRDEEGPFNPRAFEEEYRQAMRAIAGSGRALELNVGMTIRPWIPQWWREEGGRAITIASDAHAPGPLANNLYEAMAMAEHFGFRPGRNPEDLWTR